LIEAAVRKKLGGFSLDVSVSDGGFVCLAGRNGAGKTTFLRIIAGLTKPDSGQVKINGRDVTGLPVEKRGIVLVTPDSSIPSMEVDAHLGWGAKLKGKEAGGDRLAKVKGELGIGFSGRVGKLSLGMRERVSLATALLSAPSAILVDEAFSNLHERTAFVSAYRKLAAGAGIDVVFSTQDAADGNLAEHLYVMEDGKASRRF
jgi:molybdate/tungstate transport system ATP-binding protein